MKRHWRYWLAFLTVGMIVSLSVPDRAFAQEATPVANKSSPLGALLSIAPDNVTNDSTVLATFADLALQSTTSGFVRPDSPDSNLFVSWLMSFSGLALPDPFLNYAVAVDWDELTGFNLTEVDQTLQTGDPPSMQTFLRGRFDLTKLQTVWDAQGYKPVEIEGATAAASLHENAEFDISSDLGRIAFAKLNNVALLEDGTLVYASTLAELKTIVATSRGESPSLADRVDVAALLSAQTKQLASAVIVSGAAFRFSPNLVNPNASADDLKTQIAEAAAMPPITLGIVGITAGAPIDENAPPDEEAPLTGTPLAEIPHGKIEISLLYATAGDVQTAADVISTRLETAKTLRSGQPFSELFANWDIKAAEDGPTVDIEIVPAEGIPQQLWVSLLYGNEYTAFLGW